MTVSTRHVGGCLFIADVEHLGRGFGVGSWFADGVGTQASFYAPYGVAVDASGTVFVADSNNHGIRRISSTGGASSSQVAVATWWGSDGQVACSVSVAFAGSDAVFLAGSAGRFVGISMCGCPNCTSTSYCC